MLFGVTNAPRFHGLNEPGCGKPNQISLVHVFFDYIVISSKSNEVHEVQRDSLGAAKEGKAICQRLIEFGGNWDVHLPLAKLYERKCRSLVLWAEIGESSLIGPERKPLEYEVGDHVLLKVSPWKGVIRFGTKGKLAPRYVGPFEILERIGPVAYRLRLPEELSSVHDTFHVSNLKKCLWWKANLQVPFDEITNRKTLRFVKESVEIMDREVRSLKRSKISLVKVRWNSKHGPEFTWEREDHMKSKYPQLFVDHAVEPAS
ncbi:hypothetical protein Tco_0296578 [Tanacetum coccineum]